MSVLLSEFTFSFNSPNCEGYLLQQINPCIDDDEITELPPASVHMPACN